ncbi:MULTISPECIES: hypothetical protein [Serratia]|uniref:hypothetical protein n=1 Tax=Serratia TaxID=613 RepID=UPI0014786740|nr:hypothetical protein [Serratia marcescens]EMB6252291.1 hypothetical protein [Serratia marcescens]MBH3291846.1 hypothetical protein [Serratia marcescens]HAT3712052.1 hypothetical protein [Serratia marcescens]HAT3792208.1 hypothetical protein [Serratia marcescens]HAT4916586.1 hypothetical protein [Serratia marcescens]
MQQIDASAALPGRDAKPDQNTRHARQNRRTAGFRGGAAGNTEGNQRRCVKCCALDASFIR